MSNFKIKNNWDKLRKEIHQNKYECLDEYVNSSTKLRFKCNVNTSHKIFLQDPEHHITRKQGCPECSGNQKKDINYLNYLAFKNNIICHAKTYLNMNSRYEWECNVCNHKWFSKANHFINGDSGCPNCAGRCYDITILKKFANKLGGECLSNKYEKMLSMYEWKCKNDHIWTSNFNNIKNHNNWCPVCNESKGEKKIRNYLLKHSIEFIDQKSFDECRNVFKLKFDFFIPNFNLCIEFNGRQHYEHIDYFGDITVFNECQKRDKLKIKFCENNNIKLLIISFENFKNIDKILNDEFNTNTNN